MRKIAMRCTQKQFDSVREYLSIPKDINTLGDDYNYLVNERRNDLTGINFYSLESIIRLKDYELHKIWNKNIFLEACGIETKYKITKETILKYEMKDEFPEMFEVKLEVGNWYKRDKAIFKVLTKPNKNKRFQCEGIDIYGKWMEDKNGCFGYVENNEIEATEQEVKTALFNEAKKRGFEDGVMCNNSIVHNDSVKYNNYILERGRFKYIDDRLVWEEFNEDIYPIFKDGIWAEIIQTITKEEAEKKLNCKII